MNIQLTTSSHNWRAYAASGLSPILQAALACFADQGYHGTTVRTVAHHAGLSVPGVYHHYPSKQHLLVAIMRFAMEDLHRRCLEALEEEGPSVALRLNALIECMVLFHAHQSSLAFIAASEIRSLEDAARNEHIAARDALQRMFDSLIDEGVSKGTFKAKYPRETSRAIVTMCTGVAQWYRPAGELSPENVAVHYVEIARSALSSR